MCFSEICSKSSVLELCFISDATRPIYQPTRFERSRAKSISDRAVYSLCLRNAQYIVSTIPHSMRTNANCASSVILIQTNLTLLVSLSADRLDYFYSKDLLPVSKIVARRRARTTSIRDEPLSLLQPAFRADETRAPQRASLHLPLTGRFDHFAASIMEADKYYLT